MKNNIITIIFIMLALCERCLSQDIMVVDFGGEKTQEIRIADINEIRFKDSSKIDPCNVVSGGLLAYYTFDNGTADDLKGNYNGVMNGGTFISDTPVGDGKSVLLKRGEYINIPYNPIEGKKSFSASFWIKDFAAGTILNTTDGYHSYGPTLSITHDMKFYYIPRQSSGSDCLTFTNSLSAYQASQWVMFTIVTNSETNETTMYINGKKMESLKNRINTLSSGSVMTIGGSYYYFGKQDNWASSFKVDNVRIYGTVLNDEDVSNIFNAERGDKLQEEETIPVSRGLEAYYTFDDKNGDDKKSGYHAALVGGKFISDTPNGKGYSLLLDSKEFVNIPYNPINQDRTFTLSMWIKDFGIGTLFNTSDGYHSYGPTVCVTDQNKLYFIPRRSSGSDCLTFPTSLSYYQSGQWVMLTIVTNAENKTVTVYLNGRRFDSLTLKGEGSISEGGSMTIGGSYYYFGNQRNWAVPFKVDNVRIYRLALTDEEVAEIYVSETEKDE